MDAVISSHTLYTQQPSYRYLLYTHLLTHYICRVHTVYDHHIHIHSYYFERQQHAALVSMYLYHSQAGSAIPIPMIKHTVPSLVTYSLQ